MGINVNRAALVHAAKDMNAVLKMDPPIATKGKSDEEVLDIVKKYAQGWDETTNELVAENAVTRDDNLDADTFKTLELIGAIPKLQKTEKPAKKSTNVEEEVKGKMSASKSSHIRGKGIRFSTFDEFKKKMKEVDITDNKTALATRMDKMLLDGGKQGELIERARELGLPSIMSHASYRSTRGFDYKDTRKDENDDNGIIKIIGYEPTKCGRASTLTVKKLPKGGKHEKKATKKTNVAESVKAKTEKVAKKVTKKTEKDDEE